MLLPIMRASRGPVSNGRAFLLRTLGAALELDIAASRKLSRFLACHRKGLHACAGHRDTSPHVVLADGSAGLADNGLGS